MAGSSICVKIPRCSRHDYPCFIKTGTRDGPNKGKSFFICAKVADQCNFVENVTSFTATFCPTHGEMNELHAFNKRADHERYYFRCTNGRKECLKWCGYDIIKQEKVSNNFPNVLSDLSNILSNNLDKADAPSLHYNKLKEPLEKRKNDKVAKPNVISAVATDKENAEQVLTNGLLTKNEGIPEYSTSDKPNEAKGKGSLDTVLAQEKSTETSSQQNSSSVILISDDDDDDDDDDDTEVTCTSSLSNNLQNVSSTVVRRDDRPSVQEVTTSVQSGAESVTDLNVPLRERIGFLEKKDNNPVPQPDPSSKEQNQVNQNPAIDPAVRKITSRMSKQEIENEIARQEDILANVPLSLLPDNGHKIVTRVNHLKDSLKYLKQFGDQDVNGMPRFSNFQFNKPTFSGGIFAQYGRKTTEMLSEAPAFRQGKLTKTQEMARISNKAIVDLHESLERCPEPTQESTDPQGLTVTLMTHQRQALKWLQWRERQQPSGGILADDMGLGKTLTMISLIMKDKTKEFTRKESPPCLKSSRGSLIICPASLVHQWKKEIDKRVKPFNLSVCIYHGPNREKSLDKLARHDVVLTTYNVAAIEAKPSIQAKDAKKKSQTDQSSTDVYQEDPEWKTTTNGFDSKAHAKSLLLKIYWRRIILDEAHNIKNHKCISSSAVCLLESDSRWAVTGTPIQNDTMDLYSIVKFLHCSPFDDIRVWKKQIDDKSKRGTDRMNVIVKSLLLRRTKAQRDGLGKPLVSLPERKSFSHTLELSREEKEVYELLHAFSRNILCIYLEDREMKTAGAVPRKDPPERILFDPEKNILGKTSNELLEMCNVLHKPASCGVILFMVLRLRQCCSHMSLMCQSIDDDVKIEEDIDLPIEQQLQNMSLCDIDDDRERTNHTTPPAQMKASFMSTKLAALMEHLEELLDGPTGENPVKSVVVSQWTKMLDIVASQLRSRGIKHAFITGGVSAKARSELVDKFNNEVYGPQVMLVSLKAGGVGLNLIGGNHLFLLDQHWNPALEDQATDRVYRVGQKQNVFIHRFLCKETIEEKIVKLQEKKQRIADDVLTGGKGGKKKLTLDDLKMIFGV